MKFTFFSAVVASALVQGALGQGAFTINTPTNVVVCQPLLITWSGGTPPYFLSVLPGNQPNAAALEDLGQQTGTSLTWKVNIAAGTSIGFTLRDNTGLVAQTAAFNINAGADASCVGQTPTTTAAPAGAPGATTPAASAAPPVTTPAATTAAPATTAPSSSASKPATTTAKPATTTSSSAAAPTGLVNMGVAGVVGAAILAVMA